ncbi:MAG TPA: TolC family protein [Bacteroidota bacterium]|nr:TolC family protein [Bacteroidota bacterium]
MNHILPFYCTRRRRGIAWSQVGPPIALLVLVVTLPSAASSQKSGTADSIPAFSLDDCINYAMQHQPSVYQSSIDISIAKTTNAINLSGWLPQIGLSGSYTHYNQLPTTLEPNPAIPGGPPVPTHVGVVNTAIPQLSASETIFDPQLLYSAKSASLRVQQAEQSSDSTKINIVSAVSKSFYNLLLTIQQINILKEDTARLGEDVTDAYHQFVAGIVDETDYQQAIITLNNSKAQLKQQVENESPAYAVLKQAMGYPVEGQFTVISDTAQMMREVAFDTTQALEFEKRIEYRQLQTVKELQQQLSAFYRLSFLPSISATFNYLYEYESNSSAGLFRNAYPYSFIGLSFSLPIFTGLSRIENIHRSELQEQIFDWAEVDLRSQIYTEYATALGAYKSNLYNLRLLDDNKQRAASVYRVVSLQYKQGVVAYLNIIVAESNLITAEIGYTDALFQLLESKIDLEKAMGELSYNH